jgi:hypothetical protein
MKHVYYCQGDGGQWNVKVEVLQPEPGYNILAGTQLKVVRAIESGATGTLGSDGHMYMLVPDCDLYDKPQD